MKTIVMCVLCAIIVSTGCIKKEPTATAKTLSTPANALREETAACEKEIILARPLLLKESGIELPIATTICLEKDSAVIAIKLPKGYSFTVKDAPLLSRPLPVTVATYHCLCSGGGNCTATYIDDLGFGCIHSSCTGGCTGQFTYKGYSVDRVINLREGKEKFFTDPGIQQDILQQYSLAANKKARQDIYGISYYFQLPGKASCDCEGTKACTLKVSGIAENKFTATSLKIYYCDGPCNNCELTVN